MSNSSDEIATLRERLSPARRRCVECNRNRRIDLVHQVDGDWRCRPNDCAADIAHARTVRSASSRRSSIGRTDAARLTHFARLAQAYTGSILSAPIEELIAEVQSLSMSLRDCQRDLIAVHAAVPRWAEGRTLGERVQHVVLRASREK